MLSPSTRVIFWGKICILNQYTCGGKTWDKSSHLSCLDLRYLSTGIIDTYLSNQLFLKSNGVVGKDMFSGNKEHKQKSTYVILAFSVWLIQGLYFKSEERSTCSNVLSRRVRGWYAFTLNYLILFVIYVWLLCLWYRFIWFVWECLLRRCSAELTVRILNDKANLLLFMLLICFRYL